MTQSSQVTATAVWIKYKHFKSQYVKERAFLESCGVEIFFQTALGIRDPRVIIYSTNAFPITVA